MPSTRVLLVTGGAALAALTGVFVGHAVAAGPSPAAGTRSASFAATSPTPPVVKPHRFGPGLLPGRLGDVVYGQFVVRTPSGYRTVDVQRGTVQSVSSTSIVVKSPNGHTGTYTVTGSTIVDAQRAGIGSVHHGDEVLVIATGTGSSPKAMRIADMTLMRPGLPMPAPPAAGGPNL